MEQLKRKFENKKSTSQSEIRSLELDYKIAKRNMDLLFKTLGEAQVMAPRAATLTWINDQVGASVAQGSNLAILSDLSSFKVEGEIADSYADKITAGNRVNVVIGNEKLSGTVGNVTPSVNNGVIKFVVFLDDQSNTRLRSGLKVDVHVTHAMNVKRCVCRQGLITWVGEIMTCGLSTGSGWKRGRLCWERVVSNTWRCCRG